MASKRLWHRLIRNGSFVYWEIILEALVVLVVVTELCVESGKTLFPSWRQSRVEPTARLHYTELVAGIPLDRLLNPCQPIDGRVQSNQTESRMEFILLLCATTALYVAFAAFLLANRNWKPPVMPLTDKSTAKKCEWLSHAILSAFALYGICVIYSVDYLGEWQQPSSNSLNSFLLGTWFTIIMVCRPRNSSSALPAASGKKKPSGRAKMLIADVSDAARGNYGYTVACAAVFLCAPLAITGVVVVACLACVEIFIFGTVLALSFTLSTFTAVGLVRSVVAIFGETAALPGLVVVLSVLILHCIGRMMGIWLAESNVIWIVRKLRSMQKNVGLTEQCPSKMISVKVSAICVGNEVTGNGNEDHSSTGATKFLIDNMVVGVISSAQCHLYASGTTHDPNDANPWHVLIITGKLPQCFSTMMAGFFTAPTNTSHLCLFLDHPFSPLENRAMHASFAVSGLLPLLLVPPVFVLLAMVCIKFIGIVVICCFYDCCCREPESPTPRNEVEEEVDEDPKVLPNNHLYVYHGAMALLPMYFVNVILPWYALDFLPGSWYIPGMAVYLVGYAGYLFWKMVKNSLWWLKSVVEEFKVENVEGCGEKVALTGRHSCTETVLETAQVHKHVTYDDVDVRTTGPLLQTTV